MTARSARRVAAVLVGVSLFASGMATGHVLDDDADTRARAANEASDDRDESPHDDTSSASQVGTSLDGTVEARSSAGAVAAAAALVVAFDGSGMFDAARRERLLDQHAATVSRDRLGEVLAEVADTVTTPLGLDPDALRDPGFVWRVVPAGWRVRAFDRDRAVVAVWATGVVIAHGVPLTQPGWHTTDVELVWEDGAWRLIGFRSEPGPEPPAVGASAGASSQARLIDAFRPFRYLPATATTAEP